MKNKKDILFLINPISGVGKKNIIPKCIDKYLNKSIFNYKIAYTEYRKHGHKIALENKLKYNIIVAIGGDGTVNEIGTALIHSNTALGIIPTGSGNGLARHLNIPLKIKNALLTLNKLHVLTIDTATVNNIPFIGTCGFGFDAYIAKKFDEFHKRGFISYAKLILKEYKNYKPLTYTVTSKKFTKTITSIMYSIANSSQFGNGFTISPKSDLQDGVFEHIYLDNFKVKDMLLMGRQFFSKQIDKSKFFNSFTQENEILIEIKNKEKAIFHIDGEPLEANNTFIVNIIPQSLKIIC